MSSRHCQVSVSLFTLVTLLGPSVGLAVEGETIRVELRTVKFQVRAEIADLLGYDEGEQRLFYYTAGAVRRP